MKIKILLSLVVALALLQTGCCCDDSPYLTPTAIRSQFDNVEVRIDEKAKLLIVELTSGDENLSTVKVVSAYTSTYSKVTHLAQVGGHQLGTRHKYQLVFSPPPSMPFDLNLVLKVDGATRTLRADYYGDHAVTYTY